MLRRSSAATAILAAVALPALPATAAAQSELVLAIGGEPSEGYDPLLGWGRYGHPLFQSTLLTRDENLETRPDLATEWTLSDDRLTWTIRLRDDVTFSDGTPLNAEDVAFTFIQAASAGGVLDLSVLESATALDDATVELKLTRPWITFTENFYTLGIVPSDSYGPDYARKPVGSGPYRMLSWTEGEQLIVERNPEYYGTTSPFERITFLFVGEDTGVAAAQAGQVHMATVAATMADAAPGGFNQLVVKSVDNRGVVFPMQPDDGRTTESGARIGNAVTSDRAIRQAINLGIDRNVLVEVALLGHGTPAQGPVDGLPWSNADAVITYDLETAKALLDDAGWVPGDDGVRVKDGIRAAFPINYSASDTTRRALAMTLAEQLKALGIAATPTGITWEQIEGVMHAEPVLFGWGSHSPFEIYSLYESSFAGTEFYNAGFFSVPEVDAYFATAQGAESLEASYADWQKAEWDGTTGYGARGEAGWAWLVNLDHIYYVDECLDVGPTQIEPHGHGWPITALIQQWKWTCE